MRQAIARTEMRELWKVKCNGEALAKCRNDEKFPYIVTLARAANALQSAHAILAHTELPDTPAVNRDRFNSYLFASAILFESIKLVRKMNGAFKDDLDFQNGLRLLLKDAVVHQIEKNHLDPARHGAIFHFDPKRFAEMIAESNFDECVFTTGIGRTKYDVYHGYADEVAAELLVGALSESEGFEQKLADAMEITMDLVI